MALAGILSRLPAALHHGVSSAQSQIALIDKHASRQAARPLTRTTSTDAVHETAARGFSLQVDLYERSRPGYPSEVVRGLMENIGLQGKGRKRVLDLAAGTGKFTRRLLEQPDLDVVAIEPNDEMVGELHRQLPQITALRGSASEIPLATNSLDAVFAAQAFHWFANEPACKEIYRVLRSGGAFCCLWNREDVRVPWIKSILEDLIEPLSDGAPQYFKRTWQRPFRDSEWAKAAFQIGDVDSHSRFHRHVISVTKEQLWGRLLSKSYIAVRSPAELKELEQEFNARLSRFGVRFEGPEATEDVPLMLEIFTAFKAPSTKHQTDCW